MTDQTKPAALHSDGLGAHILDLLTHSDCEQLGDVSLVTIAWYSGVFEVEARWRGTKYRVTVTPYEDETKVEAEQKPGT